MVIKNIRAAISPICNMRCRYCANVTSEYHARMEDFRRTPISTGTLSTEQWLQIFACFYSAGFRGITLTGGEPTLNPDWLKMLRYCKELGYLATEITSNLLVLDEYKEELSSADYITKFKVSLDTFNKSKFHYLTRVDALDTVLANINLLTKLGFTVQINRVTMASTQGELLDYIENASRLDVGCTLLDLVYYKNGQPNSSSIDEWRKEFISAESTWTYLKNNLKNCGGIESDPKYGYKTSYKKMNIILKDSKMTKRAAQCQTCPIYCQEGIFTVRIASDGTITTCPDYKGELPFINGVEALKENSLTEKLANIFKDFEIQENDHFEEYIKRLRK